MFALPPWISLEERTRKSDAVVIADVDRITVRDLNTVSRSVSMHIEIKELIKGRVEDTSLTLNFLVFPQSMENHLREPPSQGRYVLFLNQMTVTTPQGSQDTVLVLFRPIPFSFVEATPENIQKIKSALP